MSTTLVINGQSKVVQAAPDTLEHAEGLTLAQLMAIVDNDITYIPTQEGWLYLAGIQDTFSRRIVGWSMSERLTQELVCAAWCMAGGAMAHRACTTPTRAVSTPARTISSCWKRLRCQSA